ncbi:hypothetical protein HDV00_011346 [Rhizophlyctis rosea]|nr:hypothetical protein HDV00_011346 [Rhizophlyctis rosea]
MSVSTLSPTTSTPSLPPPEILTLITHFAHPLTTRTLRTTNKFYSKFIRSADLIQCEFAWRYHTNGFDSCWEWAIRKGHTDVVQTLCAIGMKDDTFKMTLPKTKMFHTQGWQVIVPPHYVNCKLTTASWKGFDALHHHVCPSLKLSSTPSPILPLGPAATDVGSLLELVQLLLSVNAPIGDEALLMFSELGHLPAVEYLLSTGARTSWDDEGCLRAACARGHIDVVKALVEAGANINEAEMDKDSHWLPLPPLCLAAQEGHIEIVQYLLGAGADVSIWSNRPLLLAIERGQMDVVKCLVETVGNPELSAAFTNGDFQRVEQIVKEAAVGTP